jgi:hypothetical protein
MKTRTWGVACLLLLAVFRIQAAEPQRIALVFGGSAGKAYP